eukprot:CAMPEP_0202879142 /NCGR_PEP_ID=MMETSP1391-20130828/33228_1 /ASSEMBLY_ACC=CAM_ASM_000867 /TAXON_ID=1034604 /ORGANISM="Chlamydomonas leiostraca, Strain SAG 11-49" /LENGTH=81 /DNA_ID=CAMNT_0049561451 /DNA_START=1 /DNA_END=242 /DNA_ORIENTATION=+
MEHATPFGSHAAAAAAAAAAGVPLLSSGDLDETMRMMLGHTQARIHAAGRSMSVPAEAMAAPRGVGSARMSDIQLPPAPGS